MKINLVGAGRGSGLSAHLAPMLWRKGYEAHINCINPLYCDVTLFCGLWHLDWNPHPHHHLYHRPALALAVGSDVYRDLADNLVPRGIGRYIERLEAVLIAHPAMRPYLDRYDVPLIIWHAPIDTDLFDHFKLGRKTLRKELPQRDVLMYCASPDHQDLTRIIAYVEDHPEQQCTLIGRGYQDFIMQDYKNLLSVRYVPPQLMGFYYLMHQEYRGYFHRDEDTIGKMACEALYLGLDTYANDRQIKSIPLYMLPHVALASLDELLKAIVGEV